METTIDTTTILTKDQHFQVTTESLTGNGLTWTVDEIEADWRRYRAHVEDILMTKDAFMEWMTDNGGHEGLTADQREKDWRGYQKDIEATLDHW